MADSAGLLNDPEFRAMLQKRSRLRWGFSAVLITAYLLWGICGVYFKSFYASPFLGIAMPTGIAMGFVIILASMALAVIYVRQVNRIEAERLNKDREA